MNSENDAEATADAVSLQAGAQSKNGWVKLKAGGPYAFAGITWLGFAMLLVLGSPQSDPRHFILSVFLAFVSGLTLDVLVHKDRMADALKEKEHYRQEVNRMAKEKSHLEAALLTKRLSSAETNQPSPGPPATKNKRRPQ